MSALRSIWGWFLYGYAMIAAAKAVERRERARALVPSSPPVSQ